MPVLTYNADIALRPPQPKKLSTAMPSEHLPSELLLGGVYPFRKTGHRNFKLGSVITLFEIQKGEVLFRYRAQVRIVEVGFTIEKGQSYTVGKYRVESLIAN
jgi:hypothetical protein